MNVWKLYLRKDGESDIDAKDLHVELTLLKNFLPKENMGSTETLKFI